jgi:hypothetical protein
MAVAKKAGTAVAAKKSVSLVSMQDAIKGELAELASRTGAPGGDMIRVTQDKKFVTPNGDMTVLNVVIVDFVTQRAFYDRPFDKKNQTPPACIAISAKPTGMAPFKDVPVRQSDNCDGCPMNEWGSDGDGKACKEHRLLAVIPEDADATTEVALLSVSPTALKAYDGYVRSLAASLQKAPFQVLTEIKFAEDQTYATLRFGNPRPADPDLVAIAFSLREAARTRLLAKPDTSGYVPLSSTGKPKARVAARR